MSIAAIEQKKVVVSEIAENFRNSASSVVCEYRGLTVAEVTELRRALRAEGVEIKVYKNSMAQRAAEECGYNELVDSLVGPNALVFGSDAVAPARVLAKFAKKHKNLVLKAGVVENKILNESELKVIAELPNKEGMISMLLGCLQAPVRNFALTVKAIAEKEENK